MLIHQYSHALWFSSIFYDLDFSFEVAFRCCIVLLRVACLLVTFPGLLQYAVKADQAYCYPRLCKLLNVKFVSARPKSDGLGKGNYVFVVGPRAPAMPAGS